jgi:hypothetical protein
MDLSQLSKLKQYLVSNAMAPAELGAKGVYSAWKESISPEYRFALQTLYGNRKQPFTNEDLTASELQGYSDIIKETEQRRKDTYPSLIKDNKLALETLNKDLAVKQEQYSKFPKDIKYWTDDHWALFQELQDMQRQKATLQNDYDIAKRRTEKFKEGKGDIQYKDYQKFNNPTNDPTQVQDSSLALANTVGAFNYQKTPQGYNIKDRWDFDNRVDRPFIARYEQGGYPAVFKDVWDSGDIGTLPVGLAIKKIGKDGRDINITVPK